METRGLARGAAALVVLAGLGGCKMLTQQLEHEIFAETLELTMERPSDLRPPDGLRVLSTEDREVNLAWDPVLVGDVAGYAILRATDIGGRYELIGRTTSRFGTIYADSGEVDERLGDGITYHYRIHPYDRTGRVSRSHAFVSATTEPQPDTPRGLRTYSNLPRRVVLVWEPTERRSTTGYRVLRSPTVAGPWENVGFADGRLNTIYEDEVPGDLRVMYYRLIATNRFGGESSANEPVRAVTKAEPLPPVGLEVAGSALGRVELTWSPNVEADLSGYEIWRKDEVESAWGAEARVGEVDASATRFEDRDVGCGQRVRYRLRARDWDGLTSEYSAPLETTGESIGLEFQTGANGEHRLYWSRQRTVGWPQIRVTELRRALPDRDLIEVSGVSSARLDELESGSHRLVVVLHDPGSANGAPERTRRCEITVQVP